MHLSVRRIAGVLIGFTALAVAFGFPYSLLSEYGHFGSSPDVDLISYAGIAIVAGPVVAAGVWLIMRKPLPAIAAGVLLRLVAGVTGGLLGQQKKARSQHNVATACTPVERAELQALGTLPFDGEYGTGNADGSCSGTLGDRSPDKVQSTLTARGWVERQPGEFSREGMTLVVEVADEGEKGLNITLRLPG